MDKLSVLIAGMSSSYLEISKKLLKFHYDNCDVEFAHTGNDCIKKASENQYDLILFDFDLGDKDGLEILDTLKEHKNDVALVVLIDEGDERKAIRSLELGAQDYIYKTRGYLTALPFTIRKILQGKNGVSEENDKKQKSYTKKVNTEKGYFILDSKGRILSVNSEMERLTKYSEEELLELTFSDLLPENKEKSFYDWLSRINSNGQSIPSFKTEILGKAGERVLLDIMLTAIKDDRQNILSYRGELVDVQPSSRSLTASKELDQYRMINEISTLITTSYQEPLTIFLEKISKLVCTLFDFQRSTFALLDRKKRVFIKQATVGYNKPATGDKRGLEVPQEVIERVFENRFKVKVIYYNQDHRSTENYLNSKFPERRTQNRRASREWHERDLIMVNLLNKDERTFGYISLDRPVPGNFPKRDTFHNLELFGKLVSMAIENYYQFSELEKGSRRLKQILVTSNIFKLYLSLNELLKEVVWSIKFSLNFNMVALGLISKRTGNFEVKAVACDNKIKSNQLMSLSFPLDIFSRVFKNEYSCSKSYFVVKEEDVIRSFKEIYFEHVINEKSNGHWPSWGMLLVPLKSRENKVIGVLMIDDPVNNKIPDRETIKTLEILANQIAVAIDNRVLYANLKNKVRKFEDQAMKQRNFQSGYSTPGKRRFVDRFFK